MAKHRALYASNNTGARQPRRVSSIPVLFLAALAALWALPACAQTAITVEPLLLYGYGQSGPFPGAYTAAAALADLNEVAGGCYGYMDYCHSYSDLVPNGIIVDGEMSSYSFSATLCATPTGKV